MITIGAKYKDVLTNFEGIAIGYAFYITGCATALIQEHCYETNKKPEAEWIDETRLIQVGEEVVTLPDVEDNPLGEDLGAPSVRAITGADREPPKR